MVLQRDVKMRGFTLVELMIVVAIIAIITSIAIPYYLNFQTRAKQAEARSNLGALRTCLVSHYAENNTYNVGNEGTIVYTPADNDGVPFGQSSLARGNNRQWDNATHFSTIGFTAETAVYFNYSLATSALNGPSSSFTIMASADLDKNSAIAHFYLNETSTAINLVGDTF